MRTFAARRLLLTLQLIVRDRLVDGLNRATLALHQNPAKLARALGSGGGERRGEGGGKRRGRPKGSKNKARATEAAEAADDDGVDPLGLLADELEEAGGTEELKKQTAKLRQGWTYCEYHDDLPDPHLQPERIWQGITHPKLLRRSHDAASGRLRAIETHT